MFTLNLFGLLGILEVIVVVVVWAGVMSFKWRGASRDVAALRQQLKEAPIVSSPIIAAPVNAPGEPSVPPPEYADFLREQIERSNLLLGEAIPEQAEAALEAAQQDDEIRIRQMLAARHQFLQLELDVQNAPQDEDRLAQRQRLVAGMQALLNGLSSQPTALSGGDESTDDGSEGETARIGRNEIDKMQEQIGYLRKVIDNQHSAMRELRSLLEKHEGDSDELQEALRKLGDAQAQAVELNRCLEVIEHENDRLKDARHGVTHKGSVVNPDADLLRDLVGDQQRTIGKLRNMLRAITPEGGKAGELEEAINKIQRSNNELNSCVVVLEDENNMLRGQVETLRGRLANLEADSLNAEPHAAVAAVGSVEATDIDAIMEAASQGTPEVIPEVIPELTQVAMEAPGEELEPMTTVAALPAVTDIDVDALLESAAIQAAPESVSADADIDALLESFSRDASPAPPVVPAPADKSAPPADDTDALLAELFGGTPPASR